jgi:hypothetical protein
MSERLPSLIRRILKLLAFARPRAAAGALFEELEFLLQSELKEPRRYASIIAAIARGGTKLGQVVNRVPGIKDTTQITPYLEPLIRMRIIERVRSLDADENSRDNRYYVSDPLFRFYYRFILPNLSPISLGFGRQVYERQIQPHLSECMGWAFRLHAQERFDVPASEIGKIWDPTSTSISPAVSWISRESSVNESGRTPLWASRYIGICLKISPNPNSSPKGGRKTPCISIFLPEGLHRRPSETGGHGRKHSVDRNR